MPSPSPQSPGAHLPAPLSLPAVSWAQTSPDLSLLLPAPRPAPARLHVTSTPRGSRGGARDDERRPPRPNPPAPSARSCPRREEQGGSSERLRTAPCPPGPRAGPAAAAWPESRRGLTPRAPGWGGVNTGSPEGPGLNLGEGQQSGLRTEAGFGSLVPSPRGYQFWGRVSKEPTPGDRAAPALWPLLLPSVETRACGGRVPSGQGSEGVR